MNKWDIARRDLLKSLGLGAACLPILNASAVWAHSPSRRDYKRFVIIHATAGYWHGELAAAGRRAGGADAAQLGSAPLEPYKDDIIFLHST